MKQENLDQDMRMDEQDTVMGIEDRERLEITEGEF
jgi:hypothetical protein